MDNSTFQWVIPKTSQCFPGSLTDLAWNGINELPAAVRFSGTLVLSRHLGIGNVFIFGFIFRILYHFYHLLCQCMGHSLKDPIENMRW